MTEENIAANQKLLRMPEVMDRTGLGKSSVYSGMRAGTFPSSVQVSRRVVAWKESDILEWINGRSEWQATAEAETKNNPNPPRERFLKMQEQASAFEPSDVITSIAFDLESAMIKAGLRPGVDYKVIDLFRISAPTAAAACAHLYK